MTDMKSNMVESCYFCQIF